MAATERVLLTPSEVATRWRVNAGTVRRWIKQGKLPAFRTPGGHARVDLHDVASLLAQGNRCVRCRGPLVGARVDESDLVVCGLCEGEMDERATNA